MAPQTEISVPGIGGSGDTRPPGRGVHNPLLSGKRFTDARRKPPGGAMGAMISWWLSSVPDLKPAEINRRFRALIEPALS